MNSQDFDALASNYGKSSTVWSQGDFNYDGVVNTTDFNMLAANYNQVLPPSAQPLLGTLVPEPGMLTCFGGLAAWGVRRRRPRL